MRRPAPTRTGLLLGVLLAVAGCGGTAPDGATAQSSSAPASSAAPSSSAPAASCADRTLAGLSLDEQVGQLLMVGVPAADPASGTAALSGVPVGGLFLQGRSSADASSVTASVAELQEGAAVPLQIAVDQEGGLVQTLKGPGFDRVPTALEQGRQDPAALRSTTAGWAGQLHAAGITMDLGPVADTVPAGTEADNPPIGAFDRQFGSDPEAVAASVTAVVEGLQDAGVVATAKHFPGLGRVRVNTDTDLGATDPETSPDDPFLGPFAAAVDAGVGAVMVSSATYPQLDPDSPALFSPAVLDLLRGQLGFTGVVMSDDVGDAEAVSQTPVAERAVESVAAGVDVVLTVSPADATPMAQALADRAADDEAFAGRVTESAGRVLALKERFGLLTC
ncbi:Beta-N-acetylhexosaminidase (fragment) [Modestobacter italicus]|uniref:beta-N-acetylhexosaminidase n=1 Tax=Modestobacter italicus (strain DSM 44449 / CECT 9708 / BC 501) TaxID=2732864 RepID=I4F242_MODI5